MLIFKTALITILTVLIATPAWAASAQPAFDRVMETKTIKCVYAVWEPDLIVDPISGKIHGISVDIIEAVAKKLGLELIWEEQAGYDTFTQNLQNGRQDMMCAGVWPSAIRAPYLEFTQTPYFSPIYAYVRAGDTRFDTNAQLLNQKDIKIAVVDGDTTQSIAQTDFPNAQQISLPQQSEGSLLLMEVITGKADVTFLDPILAQGFEEANPGTIRRIPFSDPLRVFGEPFAVNKGETKLRDMMNIAIHEALQDGTIDRILASHEKAKHYMPVAKPYALK